LSTYRTGPQPALSAAASRGQLEIVKVLLENGADVNRGNPLSAALSSKHLEVASLLLEKGSRDPKALEAAVMSRNLAACRLVVEKLPDLEFDRLGWAGLSPLHWAAVGGNLAIVELLLNAGADPNTRDSDELTALHFAVSHQYADVVSLLLEKGATVNMVAKRDPTECALSPTAYNCSGLAPLHVAVLLGCAKIIRILVDHGADVNLKATKDSSEFTGKTPFELAAEKPALASLLGKSEQGGEAGSFS
jgi:ankyrin repeat protein